MLLQFPKSSAHLKRTGCFGEFLDELWQCCTMEELAIFAIQARAQWERDGWNESFKYAGDDALENHFKSLLPLKDQLLASLAAEGIPAPIPDTITNKDTSMVDYTEVYKSNSEYLKAEDIGNDFWELTIINAELVDFEAKENKGPERKIVLSFHETDKTMPLNKTNAQSIGGLYGTDTDGWLNRKILLFSAPVEYQGKKTFGIRVRAPQQSKSPQRPFSAAQNAERQNPGGYVKENFKPQVRAAFDDRNPPPADDEIPF